MGRTDLGKATVLGNYVYVDGGEVSQVDNGVTPGKQWRSSNPGEELNPASL